MRIIETIDMLYNAPRCAVFAFVDEEGKRIYVSYSRSLYAQIVRLMSICKVGRCKWLKDSNDFNNFKIVILETIDNPLLLKLKAVQWCYKYRRKGFKLLNKVRPVNYRVEVRIGSPGFLAQVIIITNRSNKYLVKEFNSMEEATLYIKNTSLEEMIITAKQDLIKDPADVL